MENVWLESALWISLALAASVISIRVAMSVALVEIMVQAVDTLPDVFNDLPDNDNWKEAKAAIPPQPFAGSPPKVIYSDKPAELILIDGQPTLEDVPGTSLARVSNTHSDLFFLETDGSWYFRPPGDGSARPA